MRTVIRLVSILLIFSLLVLTSSCETYHYEGAAVGGALGGIAGALLDSKNPWRGGVIGAALGAVAGATLTEISMRGSREAAQTGRPVEYRTEDGRGVYRAEPVGYDAQTKCHKVQERVWEDGRLVKDQIREVCESDKTEPGYMGEPGTYNYPPPPSDYEREGYYYEDRGGPPPWAPAHGYRAKHRYRYYPSAYVYYSVDRDVYFYYSSNKWVESTWVPRGIYLDPDDYVILEMDDEKPFNYHRDVVKRYPPGYKKNKQKGYY